MTTGVTDKLVSNQHLAPMGKNRIGMKRIICKHCGRGDWLEMIGLTYVMSFLWLLCVGFILAVCATIAVPYFWSAADQQHAAHVAYCKHGGYTDGFCKTDAGL